jgi:hypothetical protein
MRAQNPEKQAPYGSQARLKSNKIKKKFCQVDKIKNKKI